MTLEISADHAGAPNASAGPAVAVDDVRRGDARLRGYAVGQGCPVLFQHGLGGAVDQVDEAFPDMAGLCRLTLECRGHGRSDAGRERPFSIAMFADDVLAFVDGRGVPAFVAGGLSMGAAVALRIAVRQPGRVRALILVRPAWLFAAAPPGMAPFGEIAAALRAYPPDEARARFAAGATGLRLAREAPANLAGLLSFFERRDPPVTADLCAGIATADPGVSREQVADLRIPALVIGHAGDRVHPLSVAQTLAAVLPGAMFVAVPPRADGKAAHLHAVRAAIAAFMAGLGP